MERAHHHLELAHAFERRRRRGVARRRARSTPACCSPSSCCSPRFTRCHSSRCWCTGISSTAVTPSDARCRIAGSEARPEIRAAQRFGHVGMQRREAPDVQLVDERLVPRRPQRSIVSPRERRVDDGGERRMGGAVARRRTSCRPRRIGSRTAIRATAAARPTTLAYGSMHDLVGIEAMPAIAARTGRGRDSRTAGRACTSGR